MADDARQESDDSRLGDLVDHVLGQSTASERDALRAEIADDVELAVECGDLRRMFDEMRSLRVAPSGNVAIAMRFAAHRRARLRGDGRPVHVATRIVQVLGVAAAMLVGFVFLDRFARHGTVEKVQPLVSQAIVREVPSVDTHLTALLSADNLPVHDATFVESLRPYDDLPLPDSFPGWLSATQRLDDLREQFRLRFASEERHRLLRSIGSPKLDDRLGVLADDIAAQVEDRIDAGRIDVDDLSLAIRAMVAAGSSRVEGKHSATVHRCAYELLDRFESFDDGETATALAALSELAVLEGGRLVDVVGRHAARIAQSTLTPRSDGQRPTLLHWSTPSMRLADAGRLLRLAPAFGVHAGVAHRARMMIAAHLDERVALDSDVEAPSLVAAQLYGFGDLIDREGADRALRLWNPRLLVPDFVALHHLAWSRVPTRPGWARFQEHLRALSSIETPPRVRDSASLLLCLSMNYAAPEALGELVARGM
ncbi:MAG: hypothetical protein KDB80_17075 [Planctomycetes bacterium]|nr:hypothetical protein [Planctomycetota bacterium]